MRAGLVTGKESFELVDMADPAPRAGEVVVEVARCGICGSDVHAYQEGWRYSPGICGHEWVGTIVDRGPTDPDGPPTALPGDGERVVGGRAPGCGQCKQCRAGLPDFCRIASGEYAGPLAPTSGGFAPYLTLSATRVISVPDELDDDQAALVEPASVAMHAVRRSRLAIGDVACVVGCGPIGLMTIQAARIGGAGKIVAVEPDPERQQQALGLGADLAVVPDDGLRDAIGQLTQGLGAAIAYDCAGIPATLQQSVDMIRSGGSVCMVGVSGGQATISPMRWMMKEVTIDTSMAFTLDEMAITADLIAQGRISTAGFVDDTIDLDALPGVIDELASRRRQAIKILVDPTGG